MNQLQMVDDDGQTVPSDYRTQIENIVRAKHYKVKSGSHLEDLNWKLNRMQMDRGDYAARMRSKRAVMAATAALIDFRANIEALQATWTTIQQHQSAGRILFADAIAKTGRHKVLFTLGSVLTSPELQVVLGDLTQNKLRRRLPPASGPIPIDPLVPDLRLLLRRLESCLEPIPHIKRVRKVASLKARCEIASNLSQIIQIDFSAQAIRNEMMKKLP